VPKRCVRQYIGRRAGNVLTFFKELIISDHMLRSSHHAIIGTDCSSLLGDVLSGTSTNGVHHRGVFEGWFGSQLWNSRPVVLLATTIFVFAPLVSFKKLGKYFLNYRNCIMLFSNVICTKY
jgi:hypothetical protein